jgi:hypothetical protein
LQFRKSLNDGLIFFFVTAAVPRSSECIADVVLIFFWQ